MSMQRLAHIENDVADLKRKVAIHDWVLGAILAFQIATFVKLFIH